MNYIYRVEQNNYQLNGYSELFNICDNPIFGYGDSKFDICNVVRITVFIMFSYFGLLDTSACNISFNASTTICNTRVLCSQEGLDKTKVWDHLREEIYFEELFRTRQITVNIS